MPRNSADNFAKRLIEDLYEPKSDNCSASKKVMSYLYKPDSRISDYLQKLKVYTSLNRPTEKQRRDAGDLLEQIVVLTFLGLQGISSIKSFRSAGPQYDLLVGGDGVEWFCLCDFLFMEKNRRDIVVEAKCTKEKVSDQQFARLCSLMEINLPQTTGLGIFFTLKGATGFPRREDEVRQKQLKEARMRQVLFRAKTGKAIVVLDVEDIFALDKPASLIQILISKIRDLDHLSGLSPLEPCEALELDLPRHLAPLVDKFMTKLNTP